MRLLDENFQDNPFLADFYQDMERWSFQTQLFFLVENAERQRSVAECNRPTLQDRCVYETFEVFIRAAYALGNLSCEEFRLSERVYSALTEPLPSPDLLIYAHAPVEVLLQRIHRRGRAMERQITASYLQQLQEQYDRLITTWDRCPVVEVDTTKVDARNPEHVERLASEIIMSARRANREVA